jgi:signal peptidase I
MNNTKKRRLVPALLQILGILILLSVILSCLPLTVPRLMGYEIYDVVSGSMEPELPVGSVVYVEPTAPEDLAVGDIAAYSSGDSVITHRVTQNRLVEGEIYTQGDANAAEDFTPVPYDQVIGRVQYHLPLLGNLLFLYGSVLGKIYALAFALCGLLLHRLGARIRQVPADQQ